MRFARCTFARWMIPGWWLSVIALGVALGQTTTPATHPATHPAAAATTQATTVPTTLPATVPTGPAVPLGEINDQLDDASAAVRAAAADLTPEALNPPFADQLTDLVQQVTAQQQEANVILNSQPAVDQVRALQRTWEAHAEPLADWKRDLSHRATRLDQDVISLAKLETKWTDWLKKPQVSHAPEDVLKRIHALLDSLTRTRSASEKGRSQIVSMQNKVSDLSDRVTEELKAIKTAQDAVVGRLLEKDGEPIWSPAVRRQSAQALWTNGRASFENQVAALRAYAVRTRIPLLTHLAAAILLIAFLFWVRERVAAWVAAEPEWDQAFVVFRYPTATGLLLSALASIWIYTQAPRLLWVILGTAMMGPTIYLLRKLLDRRFIPLLWAMGGFYVWDQLLAVLATAPMLHRIGFLAEMLAAAAFIFWLLRSRRLQGMADTLHASIVTPLTVLLRIAIALFLLALAVNAYGYIGLAKLIGSATLVAGYLGLIFFAVAEILDGLIMAALRLWPLVTLKMVQHERALIHQRLARAMRWAVFLFWLWFALDLFAIRGPVMDEATRVATATLRLGPLELSVRNVLLFAFVIWVSFALSRFVRFVLDEDVYPRTNLPRGLPFALSTAFHYTVLLIGFFTAVGVLGYNLSQFTILAGAFGVGLGFGLQNIVNNFVSGIILLFERPLKLGDTIEIDGLIGEVRRIGIRASVIRTVNGSDLIVPNGRFIAEKVTNWTFASAQRAIKLTINVDSQSDPKQVIDLLLATARAVPLLTDDPTPQAMFIGFAGAGAMTFDVQAWTKRYEDWTSARSELGIQLAAALKGAGITLK